MQLGARVVEARNAAPDVIRLGGIALGLERQQLRAAGRDWTAYASPRRLAVHVPGVAAIESNARQYVPAANAGWEKRFPGIFIIKDGYMKTSELARPGLAAV